MWFARTRVGKLVEQKTSPQQPCRRYVRHTHTGEGYSKFESCYSYSRYMAARYICSSPVIVAPKAKKWRWPTVQSSSSLNPTNIQ